MTATNHALTGVAIAVAVRHPAIALPLALLSHFGLDALPHWDYSLKFSLKKYVMLADVGFALLLTLFAAFIITAPVATWVVFASAILGMLPDAMWLPHILKGRPIPHDGDLPLYVARRFHRWIQWSETKQGIYIEMMWFSFIFAYIFSK